AAAGRRPPDGLAGAYSRLPQHDRDHDVEPGQRRVPAWAAVPLGRWRARAIGAAVGRAGSRAGDGGGPRALPSRIAQPYRRGGDLPRAWPGADLEDRDDPAWRAA